MKALLVIAAITIGVVLMTSPQLTFTEEQRVWNKQQSKQWLNGRFHNTKTAEMSSLWEMTKGHFRQPNIDTNPDAAIPVESISPVQLANLDPDESSLFRLGHSSILLHMNEQFILIDPVFSERASPLSFLGPKRFHQPPIEMEALPYIDALIISHNHYDHLDKASIKALRHKVGQFFVPLGLGQTLKKWGVETNKITELDWWQSAYSKTIKLTATPAQHFSGRSITDRDKTLWASWSIEGSNKIFFSGDSGYFEGFKEIGERLGPFDISLMETGAYNELWQGVHMMPEQSIQAHLDVRASYFLPIHNGTFKLSFHPWYDPFDQALSLSEQYNVNLLTPRIGQHVSVQQPKMQDRWWQALKNKPQDR
ncbi:MBL fold metallo-hydrolase [Agaribacterium sp. ZY112]|uniref:MBL fold metallo-hydrolase n=1 Tax=Agaribacterium sp. ZY112 TaxID=3233574 RepID=UPI0035235229